VLRLSAQAFFAAPFPSTRAALSMQKPPAAFMTLIALAALVVLVALVVGWPWCRAFA